MKKRSDPGKLSPNLIPNLNLNLNPLHNLNRHPALAVRGQAVCSQVIDQRQRSLYRRGSSGGIAPVRTEALRLVV